MRRIVTLSLLLLGVAASAGAQSPELAQAKQAHVVRYWNKCTNEHDGATTICADFVRALESREAKAMKRLAALSNESNRARVSEGVVGCYSPRHNYKDLVQCWEILAGELEQPSE